MEIHITILGVRLAQKFLCGVFCGGLVGPSWWALLVGGSVGLGSGGSGWSAGRLTIMPVVPIVPIIPVMPMENPPVNLA